MDAISLLSERPLKIAQAGHLDGKAQALSELGCSDCSVGLSSFGRLLPLFHSGGRCGERRPRWTALATCLSTAKPTLDGDLAHARTKAGSQIEAVRWQSGHPAGSIGRPGWGQKRVPGNRRTWAFFKCPRKPNAMRSACWYTAWSRETRPTPPMAASGQRQRLPCSQNAPGSVSTPPRART
jgi:hypothetical protein